MEVSGGEQYLLLTIMDTKEPVIITRDVEALTVPYGTKDMLQKGEVAYLSQSLGGSHTVIVNGSMYRIDGTDADALGLEPTPDPAEGAVVNSREDLERLVWAQMKTIYDPEIPINIVDLGLVYECKIDPVPEGGHKIGIKMTLTAPGCGMGDILRQDLLRKIQNLPTVKEADIQVVFDPPWNQGMMSDTAKLQLGFM